MNKNINEEKIYDKINQFIGACYGLDEVDNPCYNIKELARVLTKFLKDGEAVANVSMRDFLRSYIPGFAECQEDEYDLTEDNLKQAIEDVEYDECMWEDIDEAISDAIRPYIKKGGDR